MKQKINLKTPITYWGGKQQMLKYILPIIPEHKIYNEPFFGGGALYFAKEPAKVEFINDKNDCVIAFYDCLKNNFEALKNKVKSTLFSQTQHKEAKKIYKNSKNFSIIEVAWAVFVLSSQSRDSNFVNAWRFAKDKNLAKMLENKKLLLTNEIYSKRFENTAIFCDDALKILSKTDSEDTFHFIDPPYFNANMGHYNGYKKDDFIKLLELLSNLKGKFILTTYPSDVLDKFIEKNNWTSKKLTFSKSSAIKNFIKTEVITANFDFSENLKNVAKIEEKLVA